jgi:hypothetical protein
MACNMYALRTYFLIPLRKVNRQLALLIDAIQIQNLSKWAPNNDNNQRFLSE